MRNRLSIFAVLILVSYGMFGVQSAQATRYRTPGIRGTAHDFARRFGCYDGYLNGTRTDRACTPWGTTGSDEICIFCHAPHNAKATVDAPLWNRALDTTTSYTTYTMSSGTVASGQPGGVSKLCLSCHDGTIAMDNFATVTSGTHMLTGNKNLGLDLSNDHPISFTYSGSDTQTGPQGGPVGGIFVSSLPSGIGDTPNGFVTGGTTSGQLSTGGSTESIEHDMLVQGKVECVSCHEVHNRYGWDKLLIKNNTGSRLCLTCHNK